MALLGNWNQQSAGDIIQLWGRLSIIARNDAVVEVSVDDGAEDNWEVIYTYPDGGAGEIKEFELPTDTRLRVSGGGQWAWAQYKKG